MKVKHTKILFLGLISLLLISYAGAQTSLVIDTIYVNEKSDFIVDFPYEVTGITKNPSTNKYNISGTTLPNQITISALNRNAQTIAMQVEFARSPKYRKLNFLVVYKSGLNFVNYEYTGDKIDRLIKRREMIASGGGVPSTQPVPNSADNDYFNLLKAAGKKYNSQLYEEAKTLFEQAHKKNPDDEYPVERLKLINEKLEEKKKKDQKLEADFQQKYKNYMADGLNKMKQNKLSDARTSFEQALLINKNDPAAIKQIGIINEREDKTRKEDEIKKNYDDAIKEADKAFEKADYIAAENSYKKAIGYNTQKNTWPQDQITSIHKIQQDLAQKEADEKKEQDKKKEVVKNEKVLQDKEDDYNKAIKKADKSFAKEKFDKSIEEYTKAAGIFNDRAWPKDQLAKIKKINDEKGLKEKDETEKQKLKEEKKKREYEQLVLENKYNAVFKNAEELFKQENYTAAKVKYQEALKILTKPEAEAQIRNIEKILADKLEKEKADKLKIAQEKIVNDKYNKVIGQADASFAKNNYPQAQKLYLQAAGIKQTETYPKNKLNEIQLVLDTKAAKEKADKAAKAAAIILDRKYDLVMSKARSYFLKEDLQNAQLNYDTAAQLKPLEPEPKKQRDAIREKLSFIARQNDTIERYEAKVSVGESLLIAKKYEEARKAYIEASVIKPNERLPFSQIKYIDSEIRDAAQKAQENAELEEIRKEIEKENHIKGLWTKALHAYHGRNWQEASKQFGELDLLEPNNDNIKRYIVIINYQWDLAKKNASNPSGTNQPGKTDANQSSRSDTTIYASDKFISSYALQKVPITYSEEELKAKYPGIDFSKLPKEQPGGDSSIDEKNDFGIYQKILKEKPRLNISGSDNSIRLICQQLHFEDNDTSVYVKLLIQNNSDKDFLTGYMMLTWIQKRGGRVRLFPTYLYPGTLPVVKPGNEALVIYVCKWYDIGDNEKLQFIMKDRFNKTNLEFAIKGSVYYEESTR